MRDEFVQKGSEGDPGSATPSGWRVIIRDATTEEWSGTGIVYLSPNRAREAARQEAVKGYEILIQPFCNMIWGWGRNGGGHEYFWPAERV